MALAEYPNTMTGGQTRKFSYLLVNEPYVNKGISRIGKTLETVASCGKMIGRRSMHAGDFRMVNASIRVHISYNDLQTQNFVIHI